ITYEASIDTSKTDGLINNYLEEHFQPYQSTINNRTFLFERTARTIPYHFGDNYESNKKDVILHYDRFPHYAFMLSAHSGLTRNTALNTFGIEIEKFINPRAADKSFSLLRKFPWGYGLGLVYYDYHEPHSTFFSAVRARAFISTSFPLPLFDATLEPHIG